MPEENKDERLFAIQRVYTKDISFESPNSPQVFLENIQPEIQLNLGSNINRLNDTNLEVVLTVNVEGKHEDKTVFLVEVQQAGIFLVNGFAQEEMGPLLNIGVPNILFPYAREAISDLIARGSLPQLILQPVNFEAMYAQQLASQENAQTEEAQSTSAETQH